jgi:hypothetical protein
MQNNIVFFIIIFLENDNELDVFKLKIYKIYNNLSINISHAYHIT